MPLNDLLAYGVGDFDSEMRWRNNLHIVTARFEIQGAGKLGLIFGYYPLRRDVCIDANKAAHGTPEYSSRASLIASAEFHRGLP